MRRIKRFIIAWQMRLVLLALGVQVAIMGALAFAVPAISNSTQAMLAAGQGFILLIVMLADIIKTDDTDK